MLHKIANKVLVSIRVRVKIKVRVCYSLLALLAILWSSVRALVSSQLVPNTNSYQVNSYPS